MTKVAIITDTHFGSRNDSLIFSKYFQKFYDEVFFPYLRENNIKKIIHMGDVFDRRKYINYKSFFDAKRYFFDPMVRDSIECHMLAGNHDTYFKTTNEVNSVSLLLKGYQNIHVYESPRDGDSDTFYGVNTTFIPWICPENYIESMDLIQTTKSQILFGHLEVNGFEMHQGHLCKDGLSIDTFNKFDMVFSGHFHHKSSIGNVHYLGNPYQIYWSDYKDPRGFHVLDFADRSLEFIQNPYEIFHKIHYNDDEMTLESIQSKDYSEYKDCYVKLVVVKRNNPFWFDTLLDKLYKSGVADISVAESFDATLYDEEDHLVDEAEDTMTILSKYIESLNMDNKTELDSLLKSLYVEALTVENVE